MTSDGIEYMTSETHCLTCGKAMEPTRDADGFEHIIKWCSMECKNEFYTPKEMKIMYLEVLVMPNGEILCQGNTVGWCKNLGKYLKKVKP